MFMVFVSFIKFSMVLLVFQMSNRTWPSSLPPVGGVEGGPPRLPLWVGWVGGAGGKEEIPNQNSGPEGQNFDSKFPAPHT